MTNGMIYGTGGYSYEVIMSFGRLSPGIAFGNTSHVAVDSKDRVYVSQRGNPPVLVFDSEGNYITSWGDGILADAHGMYITSNDEVFVVDRDAHEVVKFDTDGTVLLRIGTRDRASLHSPFNHPADVAVSPGGEIYVADGYGNSRVHKFSSQGQLLLSWGSPGTGPGEFSSPHGIWVDNQNQVYVTDRENNRVQIFDAEGGFITEWTDLFRPLDIFIDGQGIAYVTDNTPRFSVLDSNGTLLSRGKIPDIGHGIYGDSRGNLYLAGPFGGGLEAISKLAKQ